MGLGDEVYQTGENGGLGDLVYSSQSEPSFLEKAKKAVSSVLGTVGNAEETTGQIANEAGSQMGSKLGDLVYGNEPDQEVYPPEYYAAQRSRRLGQVGGVLESAGKSFVDVAGQAATTPVTYPMVALAELGGLIQGGRKEAERRGEIATKALVPPVTEPASQEIMGAVGPLFEGATYPARKILGKVGGEIGKGYDVLFGQKFEPGVLKELDKGEQAGQYAGEKAGELATLFLPKVIISGIKGTGWYRELTVPQRDLVVQSYESMKQAGLKDAQIIRTLRKQGEEGLFSQEMAKRNVGEGGEPPIVRGEAPAPETPPPAPPTAPAGPMGLLTEPTRRVIPTTPTVLPSGPTIEMGGVEAPVTPAEPEPVAGAKQPWQMTRDEYFENSIKTDISHGISEKDARDFTDKIKINKQHHSEVLMALSEGLPVPPEVLADYPELIPKGESAKISPMSLKKGPGDIPPQETPVPEGGKLITELWVTAKKDGSYELSIPNQKVKVFKNIDELKKATPEGFEVPDNLRPSWVGEVTRRLVNSKNQELMREINRKNKRDHYKNLAKEEDDAFIISDDKFIDWFEGSEVADKDGLPIIVYHSTSADFKRFTKKSINFTTRRGDTIGADRTGRLGFWFSTDPNIGKRYSGEKTISAYLNIKHAKWYTRLSDLANELENKTADTLRKELIYNGYDGIAIKYPGGETLDTFPEYVAFEPNQIKISDLPNRSTPPGEGGEVLSAKQPANTPEAPTPPEEVISEATAVAKEQGIPLKEQKKYLLDNIDEAIKNAKKEPNIQYKTMTTGGEYPEEKQYIDTSLSDTVTIDVPGDGTFTVINGKDQLKNFKDIVSKEFPTKTETGPKYFSPSLPSQRATGARITGEDITYYNEFKPRKSDIITDKPDDGSISKNMMTKDGFFTNGHYAIKIKKDEVPKLSKGSLLSDYDKNFSAIFPKGLQPAKIVGELSEGRSEKDIPKAHVVSKDGTDLIYNARYIDVILSKYPDAKPFTKPGEETSILLFKKGNEVVAGVMPLKLGEDFSISSFKAETKGERDLTKELRLELRAEPGQTEGDYRVYLGDRFLHQVAADSIEEAIEITNITDRDAQIYQRDIGKKKKEPAKVEEETEEKVAPEPAGSALASVGEKFGKEINEAIGDVSPPVGLSINLVKSPPKTGAIYEFADPELEARYIAAKGIRKETLSVRIKATLETLKNKATREYEHLPHTAEFAPLRKDLLQLAKQKGVASDKVIRAIQRITLNLDSKNYNLFARKVYLDDLMATMEEDKPLPGGFTKENLPTESSRLNEAIGDNAQVQDALKHREEFWDALKKDYTEALEQIGFRVSDKINRKNYFHHQVLDYARLKSLMGTGKLKTPSNRGFLKKRQGSESDINTDYLQAEHEVMAQMVYDIELARIIKNVDELYNKSPQLRQIAKSKNFELLVGGLENIHRLEQLRGEKAEILSSGEKLDSGEKLRIKDINTEIWAIDPTMPYKAKIAQGFSELNKAYETDADEYAEVDFQEIVRLAEEEDSPSAKMILKAISEKENFIKESLGKNYLEWKNFLDDRMVPEGFTKWQPREGNVFFMSDSIPAKLAEQLWTGAMEELGITKDDLSKILTVGGRRKEYVLKNEIAETLDNLNPSGSTNMVSQVSRKLLRSWKIWVLNSPRRFPKYFLRNLTGDADAAFVGNPSTFTKLPKSAKELYDVVGFNKSMSPEMADWFDRGGMESTLQALEIDDINKLKIFVKLSDNQKGIKNIWKAYWKTAKISNNAREALLRYAAYLDYLDQMKGSPTGKPKNFGASMPEEVMGLDDIKDRAFWLSNDLLGAYDRISVIGQDLRAHIWPFWSWQEVNFKRFIRFLRNAIDEGRLGETIGRKFIGTFARSPFIAWKLGKFLAMATAFWSALQVWNNLFFSTEEDSLTNEEKSRPHVTFGKDKDGKVIYFNRVGALVDFLEWFGLDASPQYVDAWFKGKMSLKEIAVDMVKSPINKIASGVSPLLKTPFELISRTTAYPEITKPRAIRDRGLYIARQLGLENEYIAITGKPSPGYGESLSKFFVYKSDPLESAYRDILDEKHRFLKKIGKESIGFWITPAGDALYNLKLAVRYKDKEATKKYLWKYIQLNPGKGVEEINKSIISSVERMNPLSGMKEKEAEVFVKLLNNEDKEKLKKAIDFYRTTLKGGPQ